MAKVKWTAELALIAAVIDNAKPGTAFADLLSAPGSAQHGSSEMLFGETVVIDESVKNTIKRSPMRCSVRKVLSPREVRVSGVRHSITKGRHKK